MTSKDIEVELKDGLLTLSGERKGIIETILSLPAVIISVV
jgi:HSP20 family molecular chaperone IbpA